MFVSLTVMFMALGGVAVGAVYHAYLTSKLHALAADVKAHVSAEVQKLATPAPKA